MFETVFRAEDLPPQERFDGWRELAWSSHAPAEVRTACPDAFEATLRVLDMGPVQVSALSCPPLCSYRTSELIRRSDAELYYLAVARRGAVVIDQADRQVVLQAGEMTLSTSSLPYVGRLDPAAARARGGTRAGAGDSRAERDGTGGATCAGAAGEVALVQALVPRALLPLPTDAVDRLLAVPLPAADGPGALFSQFLARLADDDTRYAPADAARLGGVALDLAAALLAHRLGTDRALPPETGSGTRLLQVRAFILQNLRDPALGPESVAAAHHISLRTLHRLFAGQETTAAAFIRHHRLERARHELADPALAGLPVQAVAARCGFARPADFSRAFRTAYGLPPREYRRVAAGGHPARGDGTGAPCQGTGTQR